MPAVYPFRAIQFSKGKGDLSPAVAPPYDVLDAAAKSKLTAHGKPNVVTIDLPHVPPKELGPASAYTSAADTYRRWLADGTLTKRQTPAIFAYRQTFTFAGGTHRRIGVACCVETLPFGPRAGGGILPHEETFSGPKEDRMALMRSAAAQFSPIFGLHPDEKGTAVALTKKVMDASPPDITAAMADGVKHEVWAVDDAATISAFAATLAGEDVFIADGHHRYTTALNYLKQLESEGSVAADHPARRCMIVLVGMSDPGLVIGPTHRVLGGIKGYSIAAFLEAAKGTLAVEPFAGGLPALDRALNDPRTLGTIRLGLYDFASKRCMIATPTSPDPLSDRFAGKPREWRTLDVAVTQYVVVESIVQTKLNAGQPVKWAFPHSIEEVLQIGSGAETGAGGGSGFAQLAVIVRPTPLASVKAVSKANQLMPQKSTFFYPKLATGLFMNALA